MEIFTYLGLVSLPATLASLRLFSKHCIWVNNPILGVGLAWMGLLGMGWNAIASGMFPLQGWGFRLDLLGLMLSLFILLVTGIVHGFSTRYMDGDQRWNSFFIQLGLLTSTLLLMIGSDHLVFMLIFWTCSNLLLARLMIHKHAWSASYKGGMFMLKLSAIGAGSLALAVWILFQVYGTFSLHEILQTPRMPHPLQGTALLLLILAALIQSGVWPFHQWLLSSLNSPTPVSGLMHAGLVNGGGFLLTRFAPLFAEAHTLLDLLFILGLISLVLGTGWKSIQNNIKGMLASSTIAQMGFMLMQCGLGLFSAAIAHLFWHGLFKCYLFLNSGSALLEQRESDSKAQGGRYLAALLAGLPGACGFAFMIDCSLQQVTTQAVLVAFSWLASTQIAYLIVRKGSLGARLLIGSIGSFIGGIIYGSAIYCVKCTVSNLGVDVLLPLDPLHIVGTALVLLICVGMHLNCCWLLSSRRLYLHMLNFCQSHPETMTLLRSDYHY